MEYSPLVLKILSTDPLAVIPVGYEGVYPKSDGWYTIDSDGVVTRLSVIRDILHENITSNVSYVANLPANSVILGIIVRNKTEYALSISGDTVAASANLFSDYAINYKPVGSPLDYVTTYIPINYAVGSVDEDIFIWSSNWSSADIDIIIKIQ